MLVVTDFSMTSALSQPIIDYKNHTINLDTGSCRQTLAYEKEFRTGEISYEMQASVYKGYKRDKIEMRGDRAEISDFPLYLNTVAGALIVEIKPSAAFLLSSKSMLSQLSR